MGILSGVTQFFDKIFSHDPESDSDFSDDYDDGVDYDDDEIDDEET